ncbi:MAG: EamA family transporter [Bacteroidetes bacterium]|nr:EamA family transporter [Bacteroidota bacterium]
MAWFGNSSLKILFGYILICLIWGTTWLAIKVSIFTLPPFFSAGVRFVIASVVILIALRIRKYKYRFDLKETIFLLLVGLGSFSVPYGLVYWAEGRITSGLTAVTFAVMPFFAAILSRIFLRDENFTFWKIFGILLGFFGLIVIFWDDLRIGSLGTIEGILATVLSAFLNAAVAVSVKKHGRDIDPIFINLIPMALGAVTLLATSFFIEDWGALQLNLSTIVAILYLAIFGSAVAFGIYFYLLKHMSVVLLSMTSFITPLLAIISGAVFLSEKFPSGTLVGSGMILGGILLMNLYGEGTPKSNIVTPESREAPSK